MSDTILSGRWTVYYLAENRQKRLVYSGSGTRDSVKDIYLALMDLYHNGTQMDDGIPIQADTPTEYKIGRFDAGDKNAFFVDPDSVQYMYGGSLKTVDWKHVQDGNIGIVRVNVSSSAIVSGDIGQDITGGTDGAGTLLAIQELGTAGDQELWIRPDDATSASEFTTPAQTLTCNAHTATQDTTQTTGEMNWANIYNNVGGVATLVSDTHLYIYQGEQSGDTAPDAIVLEYDKTGNEGDYWDDGTFDIMLLIADQASSLTTQSEYLDEGYATILARQYSKTYTFNIASLYPGGRSPIGMETANDLNNNSGYASVTLSGASGNWNVGDEIEGQTSGARAIITDVSGSNPTPTLEFYYIGKSYNSPAIIAFNGSEAIDNNDDTGTSTGSGAISDAGPASLTGLSITHGNTTADVNQDGTDEFYSIEFDVNSETLADAYEWAKYTYRRGNRVTTHGDGIEAEQYIGSDYRISYTGTVTGTVAEGDVVEGVTSGAKGTVVAHHTTEKLVILRNSRGTFQDAEQIQVDAGNYIPASGTTVEAISPVKSCPLGTFAGGLFFFAPGVVPVNRLGADANNYQTIDDYGTTEIQEPVQISITAGNTRVKDWITLHRMTGSGGEVEKTTYTVTSGGLTKGDNSVVINEANINVDEPGKSTGGIVVVCDVGTGAEHVYHFSSWASQTFTLDQSVSGTATGGDTNTLEDSGGGLSNLRVGELVRDTTNDEWAYVVEVTSDTSVETTAKTTTWSGANYVANDLVQDYDSADKIYVPLIYEYETTGTDASPGSATVAIVYDSSFYALLRARAANDSSYKIKPFSLELAITNADKSQDVIRTAETITS